MSRARHLTTLALPLAAAAWSASLAGGYFLADDFVQLANFALWSDAGVLLDQVLARFGGSVDGANAFWRPLTYATFAANFVASGADAAPWLAVNLALHLANAILVALLVRRLATGEHGDRASLFAGLVFFAIASGWEVALWIAGRYDALATFFVLLAGWLYAGERRLPALAAAALALMSKESGAVAIVLVACIATERDLGGEREGRRAAIRALALRLAPFAVLGIAYIGLRVALFGNATRAYSGPPVDLLSLAHWQGLLSSGIAWSRAVFPGPTGLRPLAAIAGVGLLAIGLAAGRRRRPILAILAALAVTTALMLTHLPAFDPSGIGGRLLYLPGALFAVALGLAFATAYDAGAARRTVAAVLAAVTIVAHVYWMLRAAEDYRGVHREMRAVAAGVAQVAASVSGTPALLLVPDASGRAPFGRNAQAGLMLPPVQRAAVTSRVLVQLDTEMGELPAKVSRGVIDWLSRRSLFELPPGTAALPGTRDAEPSAYLCWSLATHRFVRMDVAPGDRPTLAARIERAYAATGCKGRSGGNM